jgi:glyoxylase I family protein
MLSDDVVLSWCRRGTTSRATPCLPAGLFYYRVAARKTQSASSRTIFLFMILVRNSLMLQAIHHAAIICSDYRRSKKFYTETLGLTILAENYRKERDSYKLDLAIGSTYVIELFSFPDPPKRTSRPEACGLRHLAFAVDDIDAAVQQLSLKGIETEPIRIDEYTNRRFTFFSDPDGLPLELYEV